MSKRFVRTDSNRFLKLGKKRKKGRVWRRAKGIHSKIRRRRRGYPAIPIIGYGTPRATAGTIQGKKPVLVHNLDEMKNLGKDSIIIIARVGARKKLMIIKKAEEMKIPISNIGGKK
ncbi:50S ribosomal protein L32e [Candidatus Pacearchaeota archaeon]|nr:50S ribosomal protein L32e [Candidatus Pacearchaeota archaeon]